MLLPLRKMIKAMKTLILTGTLCASHSPPNMYSFYGSNYNFLQKRYYMSRQKKLSYLQRDKAWQSVEVLPTPNTRRHTVAAM